MTKRKIDKSMLIQKAGSMSFEVDSDIISNKDDKSLPANEEIVNDDVKAYNKNLTDYSDIFDSSLDQFKEIKSTATIYKINQDRITLLSELIPGKNKTDIINYVVNFYFQKFKDDIEKDYTKLLKKKNANLFK